MYWFSTLPKLVGHTFQKDKTKNRTGTPKANLHGFFNL
jgi:hypothetical protein